MSTLKSSNKRLICCSPFCRDNSQQRVPTRWTERQLLEPQLGEPRLLRAQENSPLRGNANPRRNPRTKTNASCCNSSGLHGNAKRAAIKFQWLCNASPSVRRRENKQRRWSVTDLPFSSHLCLTLTLSVLKMQTSREGCHYKDYHYIVRRAGQMFSAGKPLQCTIFVWGHQGGWIFINIFFVCFLVKQSNVHIALGKKIPLPKQKNTPLFSFFFFLWISVIVVVYKLFYTGLPVYICICRFVVFVSFCCLIEGHQIF